MINVLFTAAVFFFPGSLVLYNKRFFPSLYTVEKIPLCILTSIAYWIIGFWWLTFIPIPLHVWIYLTIGTSVVILCRQWIRHHYRLPRITKISLMIFLFFILLLIPQIILMLQQLAPSGQDMSMHAYIAAVIANKNTFPHTLSPLLPVYQFGLYPFGFSTIIAIMSTINTLPIYTNALGMTALTHVLFDCALYLILRSNFSPRISAFVAVLTAWTSHNPHLFIEWGANPSTLSLTFFMCMIAALLQSNMKKYMLFFAGIFAIASFLTNYMFIVAAGYILLGIGSIYIPYIYTHISIKYIKTSVYAIIFALFLALPFFATYVSLHGFILTTDVLQFIQNLHLDETSLWNGTISLRGIWGLTNVIAETIDPTLLALYGISLYVLFFQKYRYRYIHTITLLGIYFSAINARFWWLPYSSVMYPNRTTLLLLIPIAYSVAYMLTYIQTRHTKLFVPTLCMLVIFFGTQLRPYQFLRTSLEHQLITHNDLAVLQWLQNNSTPQDIIWNRYEDAGVWIPAIIYRPITLYHTNPVDMDSIRKAPRSVPTFAFIGESSRQEHAIDILVNQTDPRALHWKFTLLFSKGNAAVYRITPNAQ